MLYVKGLIQIKHTKIGKWLTLRSCGCKSCFSRRARTLSFTTCFSADSNACAWLASIASKRAKRAIPAVERLAWSRLKHRRTKI